MPKLMWLEGRVGRDAGEQLLEPFKRVGLQLGEEGIHSPIIRDEGCPLCLVLVSRFFTMPVG
jgi:hypothetical protein